MDYSSFRDLPGLSGVGKLSDPDFGLEGWFQNVRLAVPISDTKSLCRLQYSCNVIIYFENFNCFVKYTSTSNKYFYMFTIGEWSESGL